MRTEKTNDRLAIRGKGVRCRSTLFTFMRCQVAGLYRLDRVGTGHAYASALRSLMRFRCGRDIMLSEIDETFIMEYEVWLKNCGVTMNTVSAYMRRLRAVYNRAADMGLVAHGHLFRRVYTGIGKTVKRAIPIRYIKEMSRLDLSGFPLYDFARDMFLFSFYTRGMSFVDMAYLRKTDVCDGVLSYCRRKTGQQLFVRWEKDMQRIVDKYPVNETVYLLPIITSNRRDERTQYASAQHLVNVKLKDIGRMIGLNASLSMYVARHSWASAAYSMNVPLRVISTGMGHGSEVTTQIYLSSLDNAEIDEANKLILEEL